MTRLDSQPSLPTGSPKLKIVFASAHPYPPQIAGGSQSNTHEMATELILRGHEVSVLAGLTRDGWIGARNRTLMKLLGRKAIGDTSLGYSVYRSWFAWEGAPEVARVARPDVVVAQSGQILRVAKAFSSASVPLVIYLHLPRQFAIHCRPLPGRIRHRAHRHQSVVPSRALHGQVDQGARALHQSPSGEGRRHSARVGRGLPGHPLRLRGKLDAVGRAAVRLACQSA
jgi:hypothetical protein